MSRILVVDYEHSIRRLLCTVLARHGHEVEQAACGTEALEQLRLSAFALLVMDLAIPILANVRSEMPWLPVLTLNGGLYTPPEPGTACLMKPFCLTSLIIQVGKLLSLLPKLEKRVSYQNQFQGLLMQLNEDQGWVLQLVHDTRGARLAELEPELGNAKISGVENHLLQLREFGLVECANEIWKTTWVGAGVSNWRTQLLVAEEGQRVDEPRDTENGHQSGPECNEYRAALFAPGYCWCRRRRHQHASEVVNAPVRLLRQ